MTTAISSLPATGSSASGTSSSKTVADMTSDDFLKLLITQLSSQDPFNPVTNQDLLNQVSSIRNLQMNTEQLATNQQLATSINGMSLQNSISTASGCIGKKVTGIDDSNSEISGIVTGVRVESGNVMLDLDSGKSLSIGNVTQIGTRVTADPATDATKPVSTQAS